MDNSTEYKKYSNSTHSAWMDIFKDFNAGIHPNDLAGKYDYTREHIYWIIRKVKKLTPEQLVVFMRN